MAQGSLKVGFRVCTTRCPTSWSGSGGWIPESLRERNKAAFSEAENDLCTAQVRLGDKSMASVLRWPFVSLKALKVCHYWLGEVGDELKSKSGFSQVLPGFGAITLFRGMEN